MQIDIQEERGMYTVDGIIVDGKSLSMSEFPEAKTPRYVSPLCVAQVDGHKINCQVINCSLRDQMMKNKQFGALMQSTGSHICNIERL
jgi:hypothetical protein